MTFERGQRVGEWTLIAYRPKRTAMVDGRERVVQAPAWKCQCSCGVIRWVRRSNLASGSSRSCGHADPILAKQHASNNLQPVASVFDLGSRA